MRIAMSRPKNLRDLLCRTNLSKIPGRNTSDLLAQIMDMRQKDSILQIRNLTESENE